MNSIFSCYLYMGSGEPTWVSGLRSKHSDLLSHLASLKLLLLILRISICRKELKQRRGNYYRSHSADPLSVWPEALEWAEGMAQWVKNKPPGWRPEFCFLKKRTNSDRKPCSDFCVHSEVCVDTHMN